MRSLWWALRSVSSIQKFESTFIIPVSIPSLQILQGRLSSEPHVPDGGVHVAIHDVGEVIQVLFVNLLDWNKTPCQSTQSEV